KDEEVREQRPMVPGEERHQVLLDLLRVVVPGEPEQAAQAADVGIHRDPLVDAIDVAQDDVRGLAPDTGQRAELVHRPRYLAAVVRHQYLRHPDQALRLIAEEAGGLDDLLDVRLPSAGQRLGRGVAAEEGGCHQVHAGVGALRGQDRGAEQLEGVPVLQRAAGVGVRRQEPRQDLGSARGRVTGSPRGPAAPDGGRPLHRNTLLRRAAWARNPSTGSALRMSAGPSQPFRAMPTPNSTLAIPATLWASAPIEMATPLSRARRSTRQSRSSRWGSALISSATPVAAAFSMIASRSSP